jgi:23S rRNA (adenine1618-N6)-methyltransferase
MQTEKREHPKEKTKLHPRNKHRERYDFNLLIESCPELAAFVALNQYNDLSIDFFNPEAVKMLNKALLKHYYNINNWDIPQTYLCPPIPGRADYIHYAADLLGSVNQEAIPTGKMIKCLDTGVGANCIYPIIGAREYGWTFVGSDIDRVAITFVNTIIESNPSLKGNIELRLQPNNNDIFQGVIQNGERFDLTLCNPPFHASRAEAQMATQRKLSNLKQKRISKLTLNFGGQNNELCYEGGEIRFVDNMILQSKQFSDSCLWFSTLISKEHNMNGVSAALKRVDSVEVRTIPMGQGNKTSRIVAWTFFTPEQQAEWVHSRWKVK